MATIREASQNDIEGIASLFNSDPFYYDPWFNTPEQVRSRGNELRRFNLESIAEFVAIDDGEVVGYTAAEEFYLTDPEPPNGKVAEVKKVFVRPSHRGKGISSQLLGIVESEIRKKDYDFAVATAVCGHRHSQNLFLKGGYMATGFAPNFINAGLTRTSPRESSLYLVKAISESGKDGLKNCRTVHLPPEAAAVFVAYSTAGLSNLREVRLDKSAEIGEDDIRWVGENLLTADPARQPTLPHATIDIANPDRAGRVRKALEAGAIPVGVLPIGTDRLIVTYVPRGLVFGSSKVNIVEGAKRLVSVVAFAYNQKATR